MKTRNTVVAVAVGASAVLAGIYGLSRMSPPKPAAETARRGALATAGASPSPITISSPVPTELNEGNGGAPSATP